MLVSGSTERLVACILAGLWEQMLVSLSNEMGTVELEERLNRHVPPGWSPDADTRPA